MKKLLAALAVCVAVTVGAASAAFAGGWQQSASGYWYGTNADNSTWYANCWQWIDGNGDGIAECYYFGPDGILYTNTTTPDGCEVDGNGAWVQNGVVQTKSVAAAAADAVQEQSQSESGAESSSGSGTQSGSSGAQSSGSASGSGAGVSSSAVSAGSGASSGAAGTYVLNLNSKKFHLPDCKSVKRMKESNKKVVHESRDQIISEGYDPCKNCNP